MKILTKVFLRVKKDVLIQLIEQCKFHTLIATGLLTFQMTVKLSSCEPILLGAEILKQSIQTANCLFLV